MVKVIVVPLSDHIKLKLPLSAENELPVTFNDQTYERQLKLFCETNTTSFGNWLFCNTFGGGAAVVGAMIRKQNCEHRYISNKSVLHIL
jgi:hypothetical protein